MLTSLGIEIDAFILANLTQNLYSLQMSILLPVYWVTPEVRYQDTCFITQALRLGKTQGGLEKSSKNILTLKYNIFT